MSQGVVESQRFFIAPCDDTWAALKLKMLARSGLFHTRHVLCEDGHTRISYECSLHQIQNFQEIAATQNPTRHPEKRFKIFVSSPLGRAKLILCNWAEGSALLARPRTPGYMFRQASVDVV